METIVTRTSGRTLMAFAAVVGVWAVVGCGPAKPSGVWADFDGRRAMVERTVDRPAAEGPEEGIHGPVGEAGSPTDESYARGRYLIPLVLVLLVLGGLAFTLFTSRLDGAG